jgi:hypothetical protein
MLHPKDFPALYRQEPVQSLGVIWSSYLATCTSQTNIFIQILVLKLDIDLNHSHEIDSLAFSETISCNYLKSILLILIT